jgi:Asp-tRNA(Asn)/Glu-tRNA(Gln) amidotransferase A subunit family amidase
VTAAKLMFLLETAQLERVHLCLTDGRLFSEPMTAERACTLRTDQDLAERVDAFVARFGRLQDTVGDKLLPELLKALAEPVGPAIDNLMKAERFGWLASVDEWLLVRKLRNRMIHEYVRDPIELAQALQAAHDAVPMLSGAVAQLAVAAQRFTAPLFGND